MYYYCTYFDHRYLPRGLALYQSLRNHCPPFELWVLCLSQECFRALEQLRLPNLHLIALEDFERGDEELLQAKGNRTLIEYYFTCTPSLPLYVLDRHPEVDLVTYLDADLFFFDGPEPLYDEIADHSIAIVGHRYSPDLRDREECGIYNVSWVSFRRDAYALKCLHWWRERCLEWCYDRIEEERFADQKYLNKWPSLFQNLVVLQHKGANLALWNLANYRIRRQGDTVWVDEQPVIFFHFHAFKQLRNWLYDPNLRSYKVKPSQVVRRHIYEPYIRTLLEVTRQVSPFLPRASSQSRLRDQGPGSLALSHRAVRELKTLLHVCKGVLSRECILVINGRVL